MKLSIHGLLILLLSIVYVNCYEKCTHGIFYHYCDFGKCCKRDGTWYCELFSTADCDSLAITTTTKSPFITRPTTNSPFFTRPTTKSPFNRRTTSKASENIVVPVLIGVGITTFCIVLLTVVLCMYRNRKMNRSPRVPTTQMHPEIQSNTGNIIYYTPGGNHMQSTGYNITPSSNPQNSVANGTLNAGINTASPPPPYNIAILETKTNKT